MESTKRKNAGESEIPAKRAKTRKFVKNDCAYFEKAKGESRTYLVTGDMACGEYPVLSIKPDGTVPNRFMIYGKPKYVPFPDSAQRITTFTLCPEIEGKDYPDQRWYDSAVKEEGDRSIFDTIFRKEEKKIVPTATLSIPVLPSTSDELPKSPKPSHDTKKSEEKKKEPAKSSIAPKETPFGTAKGKLIASQSVPVTKHTVSSSHSGTPAIKPRPKINMISKPKPVVPTLAIPSDANEFPVENVQTDPSPPPYVPAHSNTFSSSSEGSSLSQPLPPFPSMESLLDRSPKSISVDDRQLVGPPPPIEEGIFQDGKETETFEEIPPDYTPKDTSTVIESYAPRGIVEFDNEVQLQILRDLQQLDIKPKKILVCTICWETHKWVSTFRERYKDSDVYGYDLEEKKYIDSTGKYSIVPYNLKYDFVAFYLPKGKRSDFKATFTQLPFYLNPKALLSVVIHDRRTKNYVPFLQTQALTHLRPTAIAMNFDVRELHNKAYYISSHITPWILFTLGFVKKDIMTDT